MFFGALARLPRGDRRGPCVTPLANPGRDLPSL
jgi:hypothetical protein